MPVIINEIRYLTVSDVLGKVDITRQTLWRWRQEGVIPMGSRYRNKQVIFSPEEVESILEYANRIEPVDETSDSQLNLFGRRNNSGKN